MESASINLNGSQIAFISLTEGCLRIHFSRAFIIKSMTGSNEQTHWWQAGDLIMEGAEMQEQPPTAPMVCRGGDIEDNVFTYRDMIPLPLSSHGHASCDLSFRDSKYRLKVRASAIRAEMVGVPKYIEHIRPT
jgi:hypothetical protein